MQKRSYISMLGLLAGFYMLSIHASNKSDDAGAKKSRYTKADDIVYLYRGHGTDEAATKVAIEKIKQNGINAHDKITVEPGYEGWSLLGWATQHNKPASLIEALLAYGGPVDLDLPLDKYGSASNKPLLLAIRQCQDAVFGLFLRYGADLAVTAGEKEGNRNLSDVLADACPTVKKEYDNYVDSLRIYIDGMVLKNVFYNKPKLTFKEAWSMAHSNANRLGVLEKALDELENETHNLKNTQSALRAIEGLAYGSHFLPYLLTELIQRIAPLKVALQKK